MNRLHTERPELLASSLQAPVDQLPRPRLDHVWHCKIRVAPEDPELSAEQWERVARDMLHRTGIAPMGDDMGARWALVQHGDDHVHLVATLARQDGRAIWPSHDYRKVGQSCQWAEQTFGLRKTADRDATANKRPTRAEVEKAARLRPEATQTDREWLRERVRQAQATSSNVFEFAGNLQAAGVEVHWRTSPTSGEKTGYSVSRAGDPDALRFGGSKLGPGLSLPKLERGWEGEPSPSPGGDPWKNFAAAAKAAAASPSPDTADATGVALHSIAKHTGEHVEAANTFDRARFESWSRLAPRTPAGDALRAASRDLRRSRAQKMPAPAAAAVTLLVASIAAMRAAENKRHQSEAAERSAAATQQQSPDDSRGYDWTVREATQQQTRRR